MRLLLFGLVICGSVRLPAQVTLAPPELGFFAVIVTDMDSSLSWYRTVMDMEVISSWNYAERGFQQANLSNGSFQLELIEMSTAREPAELTRDPSLRITGLFKVGFQVTEFDDWIRHMEGLNVSFHGQVVEQENGKRMVVIRDPDGNRIQFFEK